MLCQVHYQMTSIIVLFTILDSKLIGPGGHTQVSLLTISKLQDYHLHLPNTNTKKLTLLAG